MAKTSTKKATKRIRVKSRKGVTSMVAKMPKGLGRGKRGPGGGL